MSFAVESESACPGPAVLARLLAGQLPSPEAEAVEQHVLGCTECASTAQTLSAHDTFTDAMRSYQPLSADEAPAVERLVGRLQQTFAGGSAAVIELPGAPGEDNLFARLARVLQPGDDPRRPPNVNDQELCDFLAPPEGDDELGRLGPYRVLKILGAGGMGVVFLAEDIELKRRVALKAMHPSMAASAGARERFQREAQAMAAIEHEHIVAIFHVARDRGVPYLAMPLLDGQTLEQRLEGPDFPVSEVLRIGREIALGLDAAHRRGLIHRDIKPANIFVERAGGRVKLLDFGLARAVDDDPKLTKLGGIIGTPAFMSPEQVRGEPADSRSDLFSLGCVLYLMATGSAPFLGRTPSAVVTAVLEEQPALPRSLRPELPAELESLILRLLAKDRDERPVGADEVAAELAAIASPQHEAPPRESPHKEPAAAQPRRRRPVLAAAACVLAILAGAWCGPAVYRFTTNQGLLVIESDDPNVEVKVTQSGNQIEVLDRQTGNSITLKAGKYEVSLASDRNDVRLEQNAVTLTRGGKQVVRIVREESVASATAAKPQVAPEKTLSQPPAPAASSDETRVGFIRRFLGHTEYIGYVVFSSDGALALSSGFDKTARLWNVATGDEIARFAEHSGGVTAAALSADGRYALTGQGDWFDNGTRKEGDDYDLRLWDINTGKLLRRMEGHRDEVIMVCISGDSRWAVSAGIDKTIRQWDLHTGREKRRFVCHAPVFGLALSKDNRRVLAGCTDGAILLVDIEKEREIKRYAGHTANVAYVAFSPDESRFVSASDDGEPRIWNIQNGEFRKLPKHPDKSVCAIFAPDGQSVLTSCADGVVRIWEAATGKLVHRFEGHTAAATGLAVSPDGRFALSASADTTIRLWGLPTSPQLKPPAQLGPTPLDEWLQGRKIITVSQDGQGDHKTIEAALKALKQGDVVEVLDRGPYRETIVLTLPEDVGLISRSGARVELAHWRHSPGEEDPQKRRYWGWFLTAPRGLRISGLEFSGPKLPADTENATAFNLRAAGDVIVDRCRILHNPRYGLTPPGNDDPEFYKFFGLSLETYLPEPQRPCRVHYDQNHIEGELFFRLDYPSPITIERCRLLGWRWNTVSLDGNAGPVIVRHNVIHTLWGMVLYVRRPETSYLVANNLFDTVAGPCAIWTAEKPPNRPALPRQVRVENNIIRSRGNEGFNVMPEEAALAGADWRVGNNCYVAPPQAVRDVAPIPLHTSDMIHAAPFASIDAGDPEYLLPAADGPLPAGGAGGDLPNFIGPLAPSADAPENAWFAELSREWKRDIGSRLSPDDVAPPPPLDQWLQGRTLRTVAQDGSGEFKTIGEAVAALQPGEAVKVLDKGPYRESFNLMWPADTGLVSEVGTQFEFSQWQPWAAATAGKSNYFGARLFVTDGFRLSGFHFTGPKLPDNTEAAWGIELGRLRGEVTVENCVVLHTFPRYSFTPGSHEVYPHFFRGLHFDKHFTPRDAPTKICLRHCWIEGMVDFVGECRASILLERNCVIGWRNDALYLPHQAEDVVIRNNVLAGWFGAGIAERLERPLGARPDPRYCIVNNVFYTVGHAIAALWLAPGPLNDLAAPPKNVRIENNLLWSRESNGIQLHPADLPAVQDAWQVGHNAYLADPQLWRDSPAFPGQGSDLIVPKPFLSDDQASTDFLRIPDDSPLATDGAGGDLPHYIGAFPPGPAAEDDWFALLRARIAEIRGPLETD